MRKSNATNTFQDGLMMDLNPMVTPNTVLTNALNATLITYNGNENVLLNDMGNGRVETAYLPEGYIPIGTTQLGGIIYIVSYNPLKDRCLIGCFPSPERNITSDELSDKKVDLNLSEFYNSDGHIITSLKRLILFDDELNPGDKFLVFCPQLSSKKDVLSAYGEPSCNVNKLPRYLKLNIVAIQDDGKIVYLNDNLVWNDGYYIKGSEITKNANGKLSVDEYRDLVQSNYNVFNSKISGQLAILAELEIIKTFDVAWDISKHVDGKSWEVSLFTNWTYDNLVSRDQINLYGIKCNITRDNSSKTFYHQITNYPNKNNSKTTDILDNSNKDNTFYGVPYIGDLPQTEQGYTTKLATVKTTRKNDGTDNQFLLYKIIEDPELLKISDKNFNLEDLVKFDIYPAMPYGYIDFLKQSFTIDFAKLGSGMVELKEFRYYVDGSNVTLNWGLNAYPEPHKSIKSVQFFITPVDLNTYLKLLKSDYNIDNWKAEGDVTTLLEMGHVLLLGGLGSGTPGGGTLFPPGLGGGAATTYNNFFWIKSEDSELSSDNKMNSNTAGYVVNTLCLNSAYRVRSALKTSYSGNFVETFELPKDPSPSTTLYMVVMTINYNNEKTIFYFRLLYGSGLFNPYYLNPDISDFSTIILQNALDEYAPLEFQATDITESKIVANETYDGQIISESQEAAPVAINYDIMPMKVSPQLPGPQNPMIPSYSEEDGGGGGGGGGGSSSGGSSNPNGSYQSPFDTTDEVVDTDVPISRYIGTITNTYNSNILFNITGVTDPTFKVYIDNLLKKGSTSCEFDYSNVKPLILDFNNIRSTPPDDLEIDVKAEFKDGSILLNKLSNGSYSCSGMFDLTINTPFVITYNRYGDVPIKYKLEPLRVNDKWLLEDGSDKWIAIYCIDGYVIANDLGNDIKVQFGDDHRGAGSLSMYGAVYNTVKESLKYCDVLGLKFRMNNDAKAGKEGHTTVLGKGAYYGKDKYGHFKLEYREDAGNGEDTGRVIILYAMLNIYGEVILFTPNYYTSNLYSDGTSYGSITQWYGCTVLRQSSMDNTFLILNNALGNYIRAPFEKYYKAVEYSDSKKINLWRYIYYFNNYNWSTTCKINFEDIQYKLRCNGTVEIDPSTPDDKDALPSNLYYTNSGEELAVSFTISGKCNFEKYLDTVLNSNANNDTYIINGNNVVILKNDFSPKFFYDKQANKIEYLKKDNLQALSDSRPLSTYADNTNFKLQYEDEFMRLRETGSASGPYCVGGQLEELFIGVTGIYGLNG